MSRTPNVSCSVTTSFIAITEYDDTFIPIFFVLHYFRTSETLPQRDGQCRMFELSLFELYRRD